MGGLVGGGKPPPPRAPEAVFTPAPTRDSAEVNADAVATRTRLVNAAGRSSTLLAGTSDEVQPDRRKVLLGG
jgi:hypothetical protein